MRYIDKHIATKSHVPSPDKYSVDMDFLDAKKKMTIYKYDRKTYIENYIKDGKKSPGVATYKIDAYDEKYVKPPTRAIMNLFEDRYTKFDEIAFVKR